MAIIETIRDVLKNAQLEAEFADDLCDQIDEALRAEYGGQKVYVGAKTAVDPMAVKRMFNGHNIEEVKREFGISRSHIYRLINET